MVNILRNSSKNPGEDAPSEDGQTFHAGFGARLSGLIDEFETRTAAGVAAGITADMLPRYVRGVVKPPLEVIARLAEAKNVSLDWLWSGKGARRVGDSPPADDGAHGNSGVKTILVEILDLSGRQESEAIQIAVPLEMVARIVIPASRLRAALAPDRMNEPSISAGDLLLIDCGVDHVDAAGFYLFHREEIWLIRWAELDLRGGVSLKGDPTDKSQVLVAKEDMAEVQTVGRIVWRAGSI